MHELPEEFKDAPFPSTPITRPKRAAAKPAWPKRRTPRGVVLAIATLLVAGALVGAFLLVRPLTLLVQGSGTIYSVTPQGGQPLPEKQLPSQDYSPLVDQGNLYLISNVFVPINAYYSSPIKRMLLAIQGRDGRTLWQQDIAWNKNKLNVSLEALPELTAGDGRIYLIDWTQSVSDFTKMSATMAAFAESNGMLLWTRGGFGQN